MKRKVFNLILPLFVFILMVISLTMFESCNKERTSEDKDSIESSITKEDVAYVKACIEHIQAQEFSSPDQFTSYVIQDKDNWKTDSIIHSAPIEILEQMANVVYQKYGVITRQLIAREYEQSYSKVYKYLNTHVETFKSDTMEVKDGE